MQFSEQIEVIHQVAATFWQQDGNQLFEKFKEIDVIKRSEGRVSGFFPKYLNFPSVFFKVYFKDYGYQFELQGLSATGQLPSLEGIRTPAVIQIYPQYKAFILERRSWQDSDSQLKRFFPSVIGYDWEKIGLWLRNFHDYQKNTSINENFIDWKFKKTKQHLHTLKALFSIDQINKTNLLIESARNFLKNDVCEWVLSHGDFLIGNIKLSGKTMDVIDFEDCQMAPREFDIINFITRLEYLEYFPHRKSAYQSVKIAFLNGYGKQLDMTNPLNKFLYLFVKLDMLETYHRRRKLNQTPLYQKLIYAYFERNGLSKLQDWIENN